jgi:hypothetical protein
VSQYYEWQHDRINAIPVFVAVVASGSAPVLDDEHVDYSWLALEPAVASLDWRAQREGLRAADELLQGGPHPAEALEVDLGRHRPG